MPRSSALWITLREASRSRRISKLLQPRPTSETKRPDLPRLRNFTGDSPCWGTYTQQRPSAEHAQGFGCRLADGQPGAGDRADPVLRRSEERRVGKEEGSK